MSNVAIKKHVTVKLVTGVFYATGSGEVLHFELVIKITNQNYQ